MRTRSRRPSGVVAESLTGYPRDLLDLDLDLEADLGVDTVKQAEVFAAVRERFGIPRDDDLKLRDFPTLAHVIGFVRDRAGRRASGRAAAPDRAGPEAAGVTPRTVPTPGRRSPATRSSATAAAAHPGAGAPAAGSAWCKPTGVTLDAGQPGRRDGRRGRRGTGACPAARLARRGRAGPRAGCADSRPRLAGSTGWLAEGPVHGVYWLPALDDEPPLGELDLAGWREALRRRVKHLLRRRCAGCTTPVGSAPGTFLVTGDPPGRPPRIRRRRARSPRSAAP